VEAADPDAGVPAPSYVVICAFRRLEIWEPGAFPKQPRLVLDLIDLPDQYDALLFLAGAEPVFTGGQAQLTREAVVHLTDLYDQLKGRRAAGPRELRDFLLQCVWCLFAEDLGQLPAHVFTRVVDGLIADARRSSEDDLGGLFTILNDPSRTRPSHGLYAGVPYADGGLFERPARVHLTPDELILVRDAAGFNWRLVEPAIFGSLLEGGLGHDQQWRLSAHYTHEADIQKVVQPTVVEPWLERIENVSTHVQAKQAQADLLNYVVLDPACGSGNFLYVAYRELRRIEQRLHEREVELRRQAGLKEQESLRLFFSLQNIRGLEIEPFAAALARVTLWMGHKLAVDELNLGETTLPLVDLTGIEVANALQADWPRADAIIGNPPFHGDRHLRRVIGDAQVEFLKKEFGVGVKDYCVYWFRKAHDQLAPGGRAGLVGTNSISQNRARGASLDYIVEHDGVITSAVSKQPWPGEAIVNVSIVNWAKAPIDPMVRPRLDGSEVAEISAALRAERGVEGATVLRANRGRAFQGPIPRSGGFVVKETEARELLSRLDADYPVVRPYQTSLDIATSPQHSPGRWVIDFGEMPLEEAQKYPAALDIVRQRVRPGREGDPAQMRRWWQFWNPRPAMRTALRPLRRYIAGTRHGVRLHYVWCDPTTMASDATVVFAFEDDASLGILMSAPHVAWAWGQSSTIRTDIRYTPKTVFGTFPWPNGQRDEIADVARRLYARRSEICLEQQIGLTKLYNQIDDGAWTDLRDLHRELDEAVAVAYGWPRNIAQDAEETNRRLLELNRAITAGEIEYDPFGTT
jgi:hypothetical protein